MELSIGGRQVQVDECDAHLLDGRSAYIGVRGKLHKREYVYLYEQRKYVGLLHRMILGVTDRRIDVDHINHDCLDNRRSNLRACTRAENLRNGRPRKNRKHDLPKGVWKSGTRYTACIMVMGKRYLRHGFPTPEEAAAAYAQLSREHHGEFGCTS